MLKVDEDYDSLLATKQNIIHAGCWVHVRREFMDILKQMPTHSECLTVVRLIRNLYTVDHEFMPPDTNLVENAIRPFVIGRKNWLFSATDDGARSSAFFYSLIETAKANAKDPYLVLKNLFLHVQDGDIPRLEDVC